MNRLLRSLLICLAMGVGLSSIGLSAAQAAVATAYGTVYDGYTNEPIDGATVAVYGNEADAWSEANPPILSATTVAGSYELTLEEGPYWLRVKGPAGAYGETIQPIEIDEAQSSLDVIYLDPRLGTISGTVVDHDGQPYTNGCAEVEFYDATGAGDDQVAATDVSDDGTYERELLVGSYKLRFYDYCADDDLGAVWAGGTGFADAATYTVAGDTTSIVPAVKLSAGASLTGVVEDELGAPLPNILVKSYTSDPEDADDPAGSIAQAYTDAAGRYTLRGHRPGSYRVRFTDPVHERRGEWFNDKADFATADVAEVTTDDDVVLADTDLTAVDPDLRTKVVTGKVTDVKGRPLAGISVDAFGAGAPANAVTRRDGTFAFTADELDTDDASYTFYFFDELGDAPDGSARFLDQYYLGATSYRKSTSVTVKAGTQTALKTVKMVGYGSISGTVGVPAGLSRRYVDVLVYNRDDELVRDVSTKRAGTFSVGRLEPGTYKVRFMGEAAASNGDDYTELIGQWFKGKYTFASATTVTVKDLANTPSVNVTMGNRLTALSAPKVTGTAKKGKTLKASTGTWNRVTGTEFEYRWYRGSSAISKATKSSYKLTSKDVGKKIKVTVTASNVYDTFRSGSKTSASTKAVKK